MKKEKIKLSLPARYFTARKHERLEASLFAGGAVGMVAFIICYLTYYWYFSMIGLYIGASCIIAYIIITANKIKDDAYDTHVAEFVDKTSLAPKAKYSISIFDFGRGYAKIGKDKKARSSIYVIEEFETVRNTMQISLTEIDFAPTLDGAPKVTKSLHTFPRGAKFDVEDQTVITETGSRNIRYIILTSEGGEVLRIPTDPSSCDSDEIIELFKGRR